MPTTPRSARTKSKAAWGQGNLFEHPASETVRRTPSKGKKHTRAGTPDPATPPGVGVVVARDPLRERIELLHKEHDRLLRDISKKRAQLAQAEDLLREVNSALAAQSEPIRERVLAHIEGIKRAFDGLLGASSRLNRRDKTKVRRVFNELAEALGFDPTLGEESAPPSSSGEGQWPPFDDFPNEGPAKGKRSSGGGYSAEKPSEANASTLRSLFRRLAIALHPDKVQDDATKAERTSVMKDVTRAYEAGDLARLMELERSLLVQLPAADDDDGLKRRCEQMLATNGELRRQLRKLTSELKLVHFGQPVQVNLKAKNAREAALAEIASMVETFQKEEERIATLHTFVQSFAEGKMTLADFLAGPALPDDEPEFDEMMFIDDDLFSEVLEEMFRPRARKKATRKSRRK